VLAIEDRRFYEHAGIDPLGIARAAVTNVIKGGVVQGGSTITQQLAKNLFLSHERTIRRKLQELLLAFWLESQLTKDEILTAYLNRIYFGSGAYGIEAAARTYFNKPAEKLDLRQSAMLAGLIKAPSRYSPLNNPDLARERMRVVLSAMRDAGYITDSVRKSNSALKFNPHKTERPQPSKEARYFADYIIDRLDDLIGPPSEDLIVETTLVPEIQNAAEKALENTLARKGDLLNAEEGAVLIMHKGGAIVAMAGGKDYAKSQFNRATQARRPPGSAFKTIVFLAALEDGWSGDDIINDAPIEKGEYRPANFDDKYFGKVTLREALRRSLNSVGVRLTKDIGIGKVMNMARNLGIETGLNRDMSLCLGSSGVPLLEMVSAYNILANEGREVKPYAITRITNSEGELYYERSKPAPGEQIVSRINAKEMTLMLTEAVERGTGRGARMSAISAAGKTGTSQDYRDAWFIGYTRRYTGGVWIGNDDNSPMKEVTGSSLPASIWKEVMLSAHDVKTPDKIKSRGKEDTGFGALLGKILGGGIDEEPEYNR
jgi:penicillin-binding protein 1A